VAGPFGAVGAIVAKDIRIFVRDRFYLLVSVLSLVSYIALFWVLPRTAQEAVPLGVHLPGGEGLLAAGLEVGAEEGLEIGIFDSSEALVAAVTEGDEVVAGLDFPAGFLQAAAAGEATTVRVLLTGDAPERLQPALAGAVREIAFALAGDEPPVTLPTTEEMVLGVDRAGATLSLRDQLRPLLIFLVLVTEMFALASLVAAEIAQRTVTAVLATPARVGDVLAAKTLLGTLLAFSQVVLLALVTGTLVRAPAILLVAMLLGAVLVTGVGLIAGSTGQDFVAIVFWSVLFMIPLAVPAFAVLFPGTPAWWVQALPTFGLVETLVRVTAYGEGWAEVWRYLAVLAAWGAATFAVGTAVLGRRVARV
jgi:ABC-2 type transport system permease protein